MRTFGVSNVYSTLSVLQDGLSRPGPFAYVRYGDGDIWVASGKDDWQQPTSRDLQERLTQTFMMHGKNFRVGVIGHENEPGMQPGLFESPRSPEFEEWVEGHQPAPGTWFENAIALHYLSVFSPRELAEFLDRFVRDRVKTFVGGTVEKAEIERLIGPVRHFIQTPNKDFYRSFHEMWPRVLAAARQSELVVLACGIGARVVASQLAISTPIKTLDIGSLADVAGKAQHRTWLRYVTDECREALLR